MARLAIEDGIEGVVCTPHWLFGRYDNTRDVILHVLDQLRDGLLKENIPLEVYPGAELRLDCDIPRKIKSGELLTINDTGRYALIELPEPMIPRNLENFFWELQMQNITPVISHPERNHSLLADPQRLYRLVEMGALTQITAASLMGRFGSEIRGFCVLLLKHHLAHVIATDAHGDRSRAPRLADGRREAAKIVGNDRARDLVCKNPQLIVRGEQFIPLEPIPLDERSSRSPFRKLLSFFDLGRE
jgi:protein-tyrosine phosphatase